MVATQVRPAFLPGRDEEAIDEPLPRPSRRDALPEHTHYADTGCDLHPSCLSCPLLRCRYDEPGGARRLAADERDEQIVRLHRERELPVEALARQFGVSRRTVFRVLARSRAGEANGASR